MATNIEIRVSSGGTFGEGHNTDTQLYFPKTHVSQVVDLLDNNNKIDIGLIPEFLFGSPKFLTTIGAGETFKQLVLQMVGKATQLGMENLTLLYGVYFQAEMEASFDFTQTINVTQATEPELYAFFGETVLTFSHSGDGGDGVTPTLTIEANDYLVFSKQTGASGEINLHFSVINNTYNDASTSLKGVVELATTAEAEAGTDNKLAVTPAGAKAAVDKWGYQHPNIPISIGDLGNLRTITAITVSSIDGNHIETITTAKIPTASTGNEGVVKLATDTEAKSEILFPYEDGYAVSPLVAKAMIDYWGRVEHFSTLAAANAHPTASVEGKMVLVG